MSKRKGNGDNSGSQLSKRSRNSGISFNPNPSFGDDILFEILSRLPAKSLLRFKLVCKHWQSLMRDSYFVDLHFCRSKTCQDGTTLLVNPRHIYKKDAREGPILFSIANLFHGGKASPMRKINFGRHRTDGLIRMLKPVNGLVCFFDRFDSILVYNPCTGERTSWINSSVTPSSVRRKYGRTATIYDIIMGFGFDPTRRKHKVVCITEIFIEKEGETRRIFEVLIVGENIWRKIDEVPPPYDLNEEGESLHVNGVTYWTEFMKREFRIVAFDVGSEKFRVIYTPIESHYGLSQIVNLVEVDERMALLQIMERYRPGCIKAWIFNDNGDNNNNDNRGDNDNFPWSKEDIERTPFDWEGDRQLAFQAIARTDHIILKSFYSYPHKPLYCYDRKKYTFKKVKITGIPSLWEDGNGYEISTFVESLYPVENNQIQKKV